jgi:hypothetical protein
MELNILVSLASTVILFFLVKITATANDVLGITPKQKGLQQINVQMLIANIKLRAPPAIYAVVVVADN